MSVPRLLSDHVYDWSARSIQQVILGIAQAPTEFVARAAAIGCDLARLADRALQTLWQARLQMRRRPRSWPQVLPVGELSRPAAANGLCAAGSLTLQTTRVRWPITTAPAQSLGGDLRDQPRAPAPPRGALRARHERSALIAPASIDAATGRRAPRQHARSSGSTRSRRLTANAEARDESPRSRATPQQAGLHLPAPVDAGPSSPPSGEHRAPVCAAREGAGTGLERIRDSHPRPGPGKDREPR